MWGTRARRRAVNAPNASGLPGRIRTVQKSICAFAREHVLHDVEVAARDAGAGHEHVGVEAVADVRA